MASMTHEGGNKWRVRFADLSGYSRTMCNMHKPFERIIEKAGHKPWPNLIKNLRLSCENDWLDRAEAPAHVIAAWIGHDIEVQNSNYAIVSVVTSTSSTLEKQATKKRAKNRTTTRQN